MRYDKTEERQTTFGVGTLNEKSLHSVLKYRIEPNPAYHEIKIGRHIVDIQNEDGIFEIQTAGFYALKAKLTALLPQYKVTVVHPIIQTKWVCWVNPETGEVSKLHKSPKTGQAYDILIELYRIRPFLMHENLSFKVALLNVEEYRLADGWGKNGKRGSHRIERIPLEFLQEVTLSAPEDFYDFVPSVLAHEFTSKEYAKAIKRNGRFASWALLVLQDLNVIEKSGKQGRAFLYKRLF